MLVTMKADSSLFGQIVLETEITNTGAMKLYERLGFLRSKQLHRYYLNGNSAYRLVLYLKEGVGAIQTACVDPYSHIPPAPGLPDACAGHSHANMGTLL